MTRKRPALGRGLGSLLPQTPAAPKPAPAPADGEKAEAAAPDRPTRTLPVERIKPAPDQPRRVFDKGALEQLAESIKSQGLIQPIVVTPQKGDAYMIVAGERRWRAAQMAGLHEVPVVVRDIGDEDRLELALVENLQREDLNPIEEAQAYKQILELRSYTQEQLAGRVGKDRATVANALRLLRLPDKVQTLVQEGSLSMGHARALLGLEREADMIELGKRVVRTQMSVRATEQEVRRATRPAPVANPAPDDEGDRRRIIVDELQTRLRKRLGARVQLRPRRGKSGAGSIEIPYTSLDELDRVLQIIFGDANR